MFLTKAALQRQRIHESNIFNVTIHLMFKLGEFSLRNPTQASPVVSPVVVLEELQRFAVIKTATSVPDKNNQNNWMRNSTTRLKYVTTGLRCWANLLTSPDYQQAYASRRPLPLNKPGKRQTISLNGKRESLRFLLTLCRFSLLPLGINSLCLVVVCNQHSYVSFVIPVDHQSDVMIISVVNATV